MITVFGATGTIGRHLVPTLLAQGEKVRAVTRRGGQARAGLDPAGTAGSALDLVVLDLSAPDAATGVADAVRSADGVFLALPGGDDQVQQEALVLAAAARAGVARVSVVSVIGPSHDHPVPYARYHAAVEDRIRELGLAATILRPNWFAENFLGSAPTVVADGSLYGCAQDGRVGFVDSRDTAAVAAVTLTAGGHAGRELVVTGPQSLTFAEAAQRIGEGLGRDVRYVDLPAEQFQGALAGAGLPTEVARAVVAINLNARAGNLDVVTSTVQDLTGRPARGLVEWARDNRAAFSG